MTTYKPVPYSERPPYAVTDQIEAYTEHYRLNFMDREEPDKGFHRYTHNDFIEILVIGGINDYFLAYAFPPAGFEVANPEDILNLELWQGWILQWLWNEKVYRIDTTTREHGIAQFLRRKAELGY